MRRIVVDASITAAVLITDEWSATVPEVREALRTADLHAPMHWPIEIVSLLVTAERRGRINATERGLYLEQARALQAVIDFDAVERGLAISDLAIATGLSAYDAAYLEIAQRLRADLATNDRKLAAAAQARGLAIVSSNP